MKTKKLLFTLLLFVVCLGVANAQSRSNEFGSNWFVGAGFGTLVYVGEFDGDMDLSDRMAPALNLSVGKWITPSVAVRLEYSGLKAREYVAVGGEYIENKWNLSCYHVDAMFNALNILTGYKSDRFYNLLPYAGVGVARNGEIKECEFAFTAGLQNSFAVCEALDLNLDIKGTLVNEALDGYVGGHSGEGFWAVAIGATYKFGPRGW